jgi:hypothetical protein
MKVAVRKLRPADTAKLQTLVAVNIDAYEPGLVVVDSRLLLGRATIDVVALDADKSLVLIATGLTADEEMLARAAAVYSWCREHPESVTRLFPGCVISEARPPRLIFVVERMPDAVRHELEQRGFHQVDCVELRLLEVNGAPAVCFEPIAKWNRPEAAHVEWPQPEPVLVPGPMIVSPEPEIAMPAPVVVAPGPVIVTPEPVALPHTTVAPQIAEEDEPWVAELERESLAARNGVSRESPREERVSFKDLAEALLGAMPTPAAARGRANVVEIEPAPAVEAEPAVVGDPACPESAERKAALEPALTVEALIGSMAAAPAPAAEARAAEARAAEKTKPGAAVPQEFAGMTFPNDGVLTRQWMEFLSQMTSK